MLFSNSSIWRYVIPAVVLGTILFQFGCSGIPFYRPGAKNAQGLLLSQEGVSAFERKEYDTAQKKFEQSLELNKEDSETQCYYAETLWQKGDCDKAFSVLLKGLGAAETIDSKSMICLSLGEKYLETGMFSQAEFYAEKVIQLAPRKYEGWRIRACTQVQRGKYREALSDFQRALALSPDAPELLRQMANLYIRLGNFEQALATWQQTGRLSPPNDEPVDVLYGKAYCQYNLKRYQEADENLALAINKAPDRSELYELAAEIRLRQGDSEGAFVIARWTLNAFPGNITCQSLFQRISQMRLAASSLPGEPIQR